jgi:hypothetical protein
MLRHAVWTAGGAGCHWLPVRRNVNVLQRYDRIPAGPRIEPARARPWPTRMAGGGDIQSSNRGARFLIAV